MLNKRHSFIVAMSSLSCAVALSVSASAVAQGPMRLADDDTIINEVNHFSSSFFNWFVGLKLDQLTTEVDANTLSIMDNTSDISAIATQINNLALPTQSTVSLSIDCNAAPQALADAYHSHFDAKQLDISITGDCYGDFQTQSDIAPNLSLSASDAGAQIIANPQTSKAALIAYNSFLSIDGVNIIGGTNEKQLISAKNNAGLSLNNLTISANGAGEYVVYVTDSSHALLDSVTILGNDMAYRGLAAQGNSNAIALNVTISGTTSASMNATESSMIKLSGALNLSESLMAFGGQYRTTNDTIVTVNGVRLYAMSNIWMSGGSVINSSALVSLSDGSVIKGYSLIVNADVTVEKGSTLRSSDTGASLVINGGRLRVRESSTATLSEGVITATSASSYAMAITSDSAVLVKSNQSDVPFVMAGKVNIENGSLEATDVIIEQNLTLKYASTAILNADGLLGFVDVQDVSNVFYQ